MAKNGAALLESGARGSKATGRVALIDVLKASLAAHQRGDLAAAEQGYRAILDVQPKNVDALQYLGVIAHARGDDEEALRLVRSALDISPDNGTAHNNLASILVRAGDTEGAARHYNKALDCPAPPVDARRNLGVLQRMQGNLRDARLTLEQAVSESPGDAVAKRELAELLCMEHDYLRAEPLYRAYLETSPGDTRSRARLGLILQNLGRLDEAAEFLVGNAGDDDSDRALAALMQGQEPDAATWEKIAAVVERGGKDYGSQIGVGIALVQAGRLETGLRLLHMIADAHPDKAEVWNDIGALLSEAGKKGDGLEFLKKAAAMAPDNADIFNNIGNVCIDLHRYRTALGPLQRAVSLRPGFFEAHVALCRAYREMQDLDRASIFARAALDLPTYSQRHLPTLAQVFRASCDFDGMDRLGDIWQACDALTDLQLHSMFLGLLVHTSTHEEGKKLAQVIGRWARQIERQAAASPLPPAPPREKRDKLRVGILSSDLRSHSVSRFVLPVVRGFDRDRLEIHCYTPIRHTGDSVQHQFIENATSFRFLENCTRKEIAAAIRADDLDILIELNGFTHGSCLASLAWRPAPVQMTWIGYPFTTGLDAVDHVVMDRHVLPEDEGLLAEEAVVMPGTWLFFRRLPNVDIGGLPMDANGFVTFGTLNNTYKITREVVALWARAMNAVPDSRFLIVRPEVGSRVTVANLAAEFARHGIQPDRLLCHDNRKNKLSHLHGYNGIDIALDTFPVPGGTTTCEALWMGVPTVTRAGPNFHQRVSGSILKQCGLDELCADGADDYVARAVALAGAPDRLRGWRRDLRDAVLGSPLCDEPRFLHEFQEMLEQVAAAHGLR